jgi:peptidoglycan/xylan/chitin deacetylase (PgdA/CDA1 family)
MPNIEIRNDDIFLVRELTSPMKRAISNYGTFFEQFKRTDEFFEKYDIPLILVVIADGIDECPEWVEYVKKRLYRFRIEMHGHTHMNYRNQTAEFGFEHLRMAKEKIEKTFGVKVTRWYNPFHIRGYPPWGKEVCKKLGIGFNIASRPDIQHFRFHYWNPRDVTRVKARVKYYYGIK